MSEAKRLPSVERPWRKFYTEEQLNAEFPDFSLYAYLKKNVSIKPERPALLYYGTKFNYTELLAAVDKTADAYAALGVKAGDIVSFLSVTTPEIVLSLYALNKLGAVSNFIDPRMDVGRIVSSVAGTNSKLLVALDITWPKVEKALPDTGVEKVIIQSPTTYLPTALRVLKNLKDKKTMPDIPYGETVWKWDQFLKGAANAHAEEYTFAPNEMAVITYTSGTTATPKGVMITNEGMNAVADSFWRLTVRWRSDGGRFLDIMPVFASYGVVCGIHLPMAAMLENVVIPKLDPDKLGSLVSKYKPTGMMGVPAYYEKMIHSKEMQNEDMSYMWCAGCGGDRINIELQNQIDDFLKSHNANHPLSQGYGMSELSSAAICCFKDYTKPDSAGMPMLCTVAGIFDPDTMEEKTYYEEGEICVTGISMMKGYYNNPAETEHVMRLHDDGKVWVHTGDVGYMDEDGFIFIRGRIKQMIIRFDGHKLHPLTIEKVINEHPAVAMCAVVGVPDPDHKQGHVPLGVIELRDKSVSDEEKAKLRTEILELCDKELEERGRPADVTFIDELPRTSMGKHDYRALEKQYKDHVFVK